MAAGGPHPRWRALRSRRGGLAASRGLSGVSSSPARLAGASVRVGSEILSVRLLPTSDFSDRLK